MMKLSHKSILLTYGTVLVLLKNDEHEEDEEQDENEAYGPVHHLPHLMLHIVEEGKSVQA